MPGIWDRGFRPRHGPVFNKSSLPEVRRKCLAGERQTRTAQKPEAAGHLGNLQQKRGRTLDDGEGGRNDTLQHAAAVKLSPVNYPDAVP